MTESKTNNFDLLKELDDNKLKITNFINYSNKILLDEEIKTKVFFMNFRKVYKAYDTIYLYPLNKDKPRLNKGKWQSLVLDNEEKTSLNKALFRSQSDQKGAQDRKELIESKLEEKGSSNDEKKHEQEIPQFNFFTD